MKHLIIHGDPGLRKGAVIEHDGEEYVCFSVHRQGAWHGPSEPQLWCTIGTEAERETYQRRGYIPNHLDTETIDAENVEVVESAAA